VETVSRARLASLDLPDFRMPDAIPSIPVETHHRRIEALRTRGAARGLQGALGLEISRDVLPFSNIPAYLPPFILRPDRAMTVA
jgi:hypothetical protein